MYLGRSLIGLDLLNERKKKMNIRLRSESMVCGLRHGRKTEPTQAEGDRRDAVKNQPDRHSRPETSAVLSQGEGQLPTPERK